MAKEFYAKKFEIILSMQARIAALWDEMDELELHEHGASIGAPEELSGIIDALETLEEEVDSLAAAVEPLAAASRR